MDREGKEIDDYIAGCAAEVRPILERIRATIHNAVPDARETISYRMPTFRLDRVLLHVGAFRNHIGLYPPVRGDAKLMKDIAPYAGPKGNLRFPLDQRIPYALIARIARARAREVRRVKSDVKRRSSASDREG